MNAPAHRDLRLGERWTRRQRLKNDAIWGLARVALGAALRASPTVRRAVGRALGFFAYIFAHGPREHALGNVARVLRDLDEGERRTLVRRCFCTLGEFAGDTIDLLAPRTSLAPLLVTPEARAEIVRAAAEGKGVIFASAHLGPWERVAAAIVATGIPFTILTRSSYDPRFSRLQDRLRRATGASVIRWSGPKSPAARRLLRALRRGAVVGIPMDLRTRAESCTVPLLGFPAETASGPARMALRIGAAVIVGSAAPSRCVGDPIVITATRIATDDIARSRQGVCELTARINLELSRRILALPHGWVWMHPRWDRQSEL
jgi:KDO2-lipid IV(A) lauroyltransferase